jgi:hypothetical protein
MSELAHIHDLGRPLRRKGQTVAERLQAAYDDLRPKDEAQDDLDFFGSGESRRYVPWVRLAARPHMG